MKRIATLLTLALVLAIGAVSAEAAKPDKAAKGAGKAAAAKRDGIAGVVLKVDHGSITVQGRGKRATEVVITTDANTKFEGVASASEIKPGMRVMATPNSGVATKVTVQPEGKARGAKKLKNK